MNIETKYPKILFLDFPVIVKNMLTVVVAICSPHRHISWTRNMSMQLPPPDHARRIPTDVLWYTWSHCELMGILWDSQTPTGPPLKLSCSNPTVAFSSDLIEFCRI